MLCTVNSVATTTTTAAAITFVFFDQTRAHSLMNLTPISLSRAKEYRNSVQLNHSDQHHLNAYFVIQRSHYPQGTI